MTLSEVDLAAVTAELAERAEEHDRDGSFPYEGIALVHKHGLLTETVATRHGGPGAGLARTVDILTALGAGDPAVALVTAMTLFNHAGQALAPSWPEPHYRQVLAESASAPTLINALRVEPELGTPARGGLPATVAVRVPGGWSLSGHKIFSTGAEALAWMLVWARTDEDEPRTGSFLVRGGSPGLTIERTWDHLGLRASRSDDVLLADVRVPADATIELSRPTPDPRGAVLFAWNCLGLTALYLGVANAARDWLVRFLHERVPTSLGKPLATLPRFEAAVGEIEARLTAARVLVRALAEGVDAGDPEAARRAPIGKLTGARAAIESVQEAVALIGNNALNRHNPLERHLRDVLCARIHTPQDDTILTAAGKAALSQSRQRYGKEPSS
ncbi:acyl-CoA dehydrogenase family protein [Dactylosporangium sp. CA-092794]|uniref:acyl-CoA dehydrogenase family protein n=1 Tax=Dactylosporangium sp. CA-092794 TaxID=3239929 RepID=UPI003D8D87B5